MGATTYLRQKVLDHVRGKAAFEMPAVWAALYTAAPTDAGGGTEAAYTGYARVATAAADWAAASGSNGANANGLVFPVCTAAPSTIVAWGLLDAATGGNLLWWGTVTTSLTLTVGRPPRFPPASLVLTLT